MIGLTTGTEIVVIMLVGGGEHIMGDPAGYEFYGGNLIVYGRRAEISKQGEEHIFPLMNVERVIIRHQVLAGTGE